MPLFHDGVAAVARTGSVGAGAEEMGRLVYVALDRRRADVAMSHTEFQVSDAQPDSIRSE